MEKHLKAVSFVLTVMLVFSMLTTTSLAAVGVAYDQQPPQAISLDSQISNQFTLKSSYSNTVLTANEYELALEQIRINAEAAITPELKAKVAKIRGELNDKNISTEIVTPFATYDSISLEALLNMNDGLTVIDIFKIGVTHANAARDEAVDLYEDTTTEMRRDAFRHMTWNFRSLKDVGVHKTRVASINHEWAYVILPEINRYEQERFDYYFDQYYNLIMLGLISIMDIRAMAKADADAYAITYRDELIENCKNSLALFNSTFTSNSYIMDFWNNKVGRDYGKSHPSSSTDDVFTMAWNADKLIKNETSSAVSSSIRSSLHTTNWWYIW